ncbi:hypothetical protein [Halalkalibacter sp. APA_J-10(15)]|uniref:hypothetical protein n=1 Tax=Halalkalibacter sp. APA_J-10(15) TaxID=2933805 RepID=UPI001FF4D4CD|nr:hypothetical protein [Halalkalibacter sp. APA_J-10(15)]MCK0470564.1 hypothetical protein [Halalkalibacter sp. APA_J-10(15)]
MRQLKGIALVLVMIVTGGCMMNAPDVPAFEDEFTREFMKSTKELEEGFYLFESKTGGYTIWFPENATVDSSNYIKRGESRELVNISEVYGDNLSYRLRLTYDNRSGTENINSQLRLLSSYVDYQGEYEEFIHGDKTFYYATTLHNVSEGSKVYYFISYIKSNANHRSVKFLYATSCNFLSENCTIDVDQQEEYALNLMKSVEFQE